MFENSKGYDLFAIYHDKIIEWIVKNQYKPQMQNAICMVSKSLGQVLRLAGCMNALFLFWDVNEVNEFEATSTYNGNSLNFEKFIEEEPELNTFPLSIHYIPLSIMAVECAINVIVFTLTQNMKLQGIEFIKFDLMASIGHESFFSEVTMSAENDLASPQSTSPSSSKHQASQSVTSTTDVGKIMISGGMVLKGSHLNTLKRLGRKTKMSNILEIFTIIEQQNFGVRDSDNNFLFRDDIINFVQESDSLKSSWSARGSPYRCSYRDY